MLFDALFSIVWDICWWWYDVSYWIYDVPLVGSTLSEIFLWIHDRFWDWVQVLAQLADWEYWLEAKVAEILSATDIISLLEYWLNRAEWAWEWIQDAWYNVTNIVADWWNDTKYIVQNWIASVRDLLLELIDDLATSLTSLQTLWNNFWTITFPQWTATVNSLVTQWQDFWVNIFPTLATWSGVASLVDSTIRSWFPFYNDLISLWSEIQEFFTDPQQYVYNKLDEWFERFW